MKLRILLLIGLFMGLGMGAKAETIYLDALDIENFDSGWGTAHANLSVSGNPLTINGQVYDRGVGTHAISETTIALFGNATQFHAWVGVDDESSGSVEFIVKTDGQVAWSSGVMNVGDSAKELTVDLSGADALELVVSDGGNGIGGDHADWCEATIQYSGQTPIIPLVPVWEWMTPLSELESAPVSLIPYPMDVTWQTGTASLTSFMVHAQNPTTAATAMAAMERLATELGISYQSTTGSGNVTLTIGAVPGSTNTEAYAVNVTASNVEITANTAAGFFYGVQTLRQLATENAGTVSIPFCQIIDYPAFEIRGFMHDVGRNFISADELKVQLNIMASYKMNIFHFHLTDYPGFRVESVAYPELNDPANMTRWEGLFYTTAQLHDLVAFCKDRHITIIPELDMPGHSSYFNATFGFGMQTTEGVAVLKDLVDEWVQIFDGPWFHLGTDEAGTVMPTFISEMTQYVRSKGKKTLGWRRGAAPMDENTILQNWNTTPSASNPAIDSRGYINNDDPIMSSRNYFFRQYCDAPYGDDHNLGDILCYWPDAEVLNTDAEMRIATVYPSIVSFAERIWQGGPNTWPANTGANSFHGAPMLDGGRHAAYAEFENRVASHRDRFFASTLPKQFQFVKNAGVRWNLIGPFPNEGDSTMVFGPENELAESYMLGGTNYTWQENWGGTVSLVDVYGTPNAQKVPVYTAYALTYVYSPTDRDLFAWINFSRKKLAYYQAENPEQGDWACEGSRVWINGQEVAPPVWQSPHRCVAPITEESYVYRDPHPIHLNAGWNKVMFKSTNQFYPWTITFVPMEWNGSAFSEAAGVYCGLFSPDMDAGADQSVNQLATLHGQISQETMVTDAVATEWSVVSGPGDVTFLDRNNLDTTAYFSAAGSYVLKLVATDGEHAFSDELTIQVSGNSSAACFIQSPTNNQTFFLGRNISIEAFGFSTTNVVEMICYAGTTIIGNGTTADLNLIWSSVYPGSYNLTVRCTDALGTQFTSAPISINLEIEEIYPPVGNGVVHYPFEETSGTVVSDAIGGDQPGILTGGTWQPAIEIRGGSLHLNGTGDQIVIQDSSEINVMTVTTRTIALWFRADALAGQGKQMLFEEGGSTRGFNIYLDESTLYVGAWPNAGFLSVANLNADQWYHVTLIFDSVGDQQLRGYLDGVEFGSLACSASIDSHGNVGVGFVNGATKCNDSYSGSLNFGGDMDEFLLFNRVLFQPEIDILAYKNIAPVAADSVFSVVENSAVGTVLGTVSVVDPGDTLTYSITAGNDDGIFVIDSATGEISVVGGVDYETATSYGLTVTVVDLGFLSDTASVSINVINVANDDSDSDGLFDEWEVTHFASPAAYDGAGDPDADGVSNRIEQDLGTDPMNSSSSPGSEYVGLRSWWKLDDVSGPTAADSSGYAANGTVIGPTWSVNGYRAGALEFDGSDDLVNCGTAASLSGQTDLTISAWVKTTSTASGVVLQQRGDGGYNGEYQLSLKADGTVYFMLYGNREYQYQITTTQTVNDGAWHFIVAVRDGLNGYIYIDGNSTPAASATGPAIRDLDPTIGVAIGQDTLDHNQVFNGLIDDVRIYDIALDAATIANLYNVSNAAPVVYDASFSVVENSAIGSTVGTVQASDPDTGDSLLYAITAGNAAGVFAINSATGEITVAALVDYETTLSYQLTVMVTDPGALSDTATITITVTDIANDDSDADGLVDEWEIIHFASISAQDGAGDPDSDGVVNTLEYNLATDPNNATQPSGTLYADLRAWWKLDESTGSVAVDSTGNGFDATVQNNPLLGQTGSVDGAFFFDGIDDSLITASGLTASSSFTISVWIHPDDLNGFQTLFARDWSFNFRLDNDKLSFEAVNETGTYLSSTSLLANQWQHVAVTFTPTATDGCKFYHNGVGVDSIDSGVFRIRTYSFRIANNRDGVLFHGGLDDLRLYNRILTNAEIAELYQQDAGVYDLWKGTQFTAAELANPAISGDAADVDADQLSTLVEYALGLDPKTHSGSLSGCAIELDGSNGWKVEFNRHASHSDIDLVLEWTDELNPANWQPVAESIAGGVVQPLNGASLVSETGSEPTVVELNVPSTVPHGFIRWKVERR